MEIIVEESAADDRVWAVRKWRSENI